MSSQVVQSLREFQRILVLCPRCGEVHRLSDLKLSYRAKPKQTWLDRLVREEEQMNKAEERFDEKRGEIRQAAQERGRQQLPKILRRCLPTICEHGFFPQDVKALFDPVDFVVFDGMNAKKNISQVVLFDGPADNKRRERIQESLRRCVKAGNFEWRTVKVSQDGRIEP